MPYIKCDKILCVYNHNDNCTCGSIELINGTCLEYIELEPLQEEVGAQETETQIRGKK